MRLDVDRYGQLKHSDVIQVVARGKRLNFLEPLEIAKIIAALELDTEKSLSEAWSAVNQSLAKWFVGPDDKLVAVFMDGSLLMGGLLLLGNHPIMSARLIVNAAETINAYYSIGDNLVEYFVVR